MHPPLIQLRRRRVIQDAGVADENAHELPRTMRAAFCDGYGTPDVIQQRDIDLPALEDGLVLIRVHAASLNALDAGILRGKPFLMRLMFGLSKPKQGVLGRDVAGTVAAIGKGVTRFRPGDEVFGVAPGSCAEFARTKEERLALKPAGVSFEQGATLGIAAITALQAVRLGRLEPGQSVLINGAAGGVGTFAVQIAKTMGGHVTGVCGANHVDLIRSLGAEEAIDYSTTDFTQTGKRYDLIIDNAVSRPVSNLKRLLTPEGRVVFVGAPRTTSFWRLARQILKAATAARLDKRRFALLSAKIVPLDLETLGELVKAGKLEPAIERIYPLAETRDAFRYLSTGHVAGKIVIQI